MAEGTVPLDLPFLNRTGSFASRIGWIMCGLALAGVAVLVGFVWLAVVNTDRTEAARQRDIAETALLRAAETIAREMQPQLISDVTARHVISRADITWMRENLARYLRRMFGHHQVYVFDRHDQLLFASRLGELISGAEIAGLHNIIEDAIAYVRGATDGNPRRVNLSRAISLSDGYNVAFRQFVHIDRVEGQLAIVTASTIIPDLDAGLLSDRPPILVSVRFLDPAMIAQLGRDFDLPSLAEGPSAQANTIGTTIYNPTGQAIGELSWRFRSQSLAFLQRTGPGFAGALTLFVMVAVIAGRSMKRKTETLAAAEDAALRLAHVDSLTEIANRRAFQAGLYAAVELSRSTGIRTALLLLDLDRFKEINDSLGHAVGDWVLREVASRLKANAPEAELVARLGGDEFAVILHGPAADLAEDLAIRLLHAVGTPLVREAGQDLTLGVSIGLAAAPDIADSDDELIRRADIALQCAKTSGRNGWRGFEPTMERALLQRRDIEIELARAVANGTLDVHYQPILNADGRRMECVEALLRWTHPRLGAVSPAVFIPLAEDTGLIVAIGAWVLERACREIAAIPNMKLAVNVSPMQFRRGDFVDTVRAALAGSGLAPARLELEITESALVHDEDGAAEQIRALRELGVRIALDDFGTGFSSLAYLRRYPFDKIKIDKSFVGGVEESADAATIVHAIVSMSRALGLTVTAEGVETTAQHRFLRAAGCQQMQGFHFARPMPLDKLALEAERLTHFAA
jgi:diguanylate cyclase (GGDEF)-like protein